MVQHGSSELEKLPNLTTRSVIKCVGITFYDLFLLVVLTSTLIQMGVAIVASVITHKTSSCRQAWMILSIAFWMMVVRRISVAYEIVSDSPHIEYYYWPEIIGLFLSGALFHGLCVLNKCYSEEIHSLTTLAEEMPAMVLMTDKKGFVTFWSKKWYDYTGLGPSESLGHAWHQAIHTDDLAKVWDYWKMCLDALCPFEAKVRVRNHKGEYRWHVFRALPIRNEVREACAWFGTMADIQDYVLDKETIYGRK